MITSLGADTSVTAENLSGISETSTASQQFMTLLITQLQYQDPLNPMEAKEFTAQLAQFTELEQIVQMNDTLDALELYEESATNMRTIDLIGRSARAEGDQVKLTEDGADIHFILERETAETRVSIYDSSGSLVRSEIVGALNEGDNSWHWDGKSTQGTTLPTGLYTVEVAGEDASGNTVAAQTFIQGSVESVQFEDGTTSLMVAGVPVTLAGIIKVWE